MGGIAPDAVRVRNIGANPADEKMTLLFKNWRRLMSICIESNPFLNAA
jgi:hypothetical protein